MDWAVNEVGRAELGDKRLTKRLVSITTRLSENPESSLPVACGSCNDTKATYRFFDNHYVDPDEIYEAHRKATLERIQDESIILAVQDTTSFNFTAHKNTSGLGPIGSSKQTSAGFFLHSSMAVSTSGVPLGVLAQKYWVRPGIPKHPANTHRKRSIEEKESFRWLMLAKDSVHGISPPTRVIMVGDRESDIYDLFVQAAQQDQDILIRAAYNRDLANKQGHSLDAAKESPLLGKITTEIPRSGNRKGRSATLEIRSAQVSITAPKRRAKEKLPNITQTVIHVKETNAPIEEKPLEWFLVTTLLVNTLQDAIQYIEWYTYRWRIERYHYILKSGCRVEDLQLETQERLHRAIAVYSIVAWRLLWLTYKARQNPDLDCSHVLSEDEWHTLYIVTNKDIPPEDPPALHITIRWIALLGGFLGRRSDGNPGVKVLWRGFQRLQNFIIMRNCLQEQIG